MAAVRGVLIAAATLLVLAAGAQARSHRSLEPFRGTGTWVSIYDTRALAYPGLVVKRLKAHHIHTLFLETSNDRQPTGVAHRIAVSRLIDAAHREHIRVVGWYLPGFVSPRADLRRAVEGARFRSAGGHGFDAFALDVESTRVRSLRVRTARAVAFVRAVRARMPARLALGAITIDPVGARYWNGYPFRRLAASVDVFMPMTYFTDRTHGARRVAAYSRANVLRIRRLLGAPSFPVHPIGGEAGAASLSELRAFLRASAGSSAVGVSLWEYGETSPRQWAALARA